MAGFVLTVGLTLCLLATAGLIAQTRQTLGNRAHSANQFRSSRKAAQSLYREKVRQTQQTATRQHSWNGWQTMVVSEISEESEDCRSIVLTDPSGSPLPSFIPGQFITVGLRQTDGKLLSRCYSLSRDYDSRSYRITVKRVPGGALSGCLHRDITVGSKLDIKAPRGKFVAPEDTEVPLNLIAAGIGITPMVAIVQHHQRWFPNRPIRLFYQVRDLKHAPLLHEVAQWAAKASVGHLLLFLSKPIVSKPDWVAGIGRITAADIVQRAAEFSLSMPSQSPSELRAPNELRELGQFLICAPPSMIRSLSEDLMRLGVSQNQITTEGFSESLEASSKSSTVSSPSLTSPPHIATHSSRRSYPTPVESIIEFARSRKTFVLSDHEQTLLDAAEHSNVDLDSGCRNGNCGSCLVKVLQGKIEYRKTPGFEKIGSDEALACVGYPCGDVVIDR